MLYIKDDNHINRPKTEDERIIDAFNQAQSIGKERTTRLRIEWTRLGRVMENLEKDYSRRLKTIPLLDTDVEMLTESFLAPIRRSMEDLKKTKAQQQKKLSEAQKNSGFFSKLSPSWYRELNTLQSTLDATSMAIDQQQGNFRNLIASAKERAIQQAKTNNKLNLHRMKGIEPLKWKINEYKLVLEALEARCLPVSACVLAHKDDKAIAMATIWKRLSENNPVGMAELASYWDAEKEDLKPKMEESVEMIEDKILRCQNELLENRIQQVSMQHSEALISSLSQLLLQMQPVNPKSPMEQNSFVDADFIEIPTPQNKD